MSLSWCQTGHHSLFPWIFSLLALILSQRKTLPPNISCLFEINSYREKIMKWCEHWYTCWLHSHEDRQDLKRQSKFLQKNRLTISLILELLMLSWNINVCISLLAMHACPRFESDSFKSTANWKTLFSLRGYLQFDYFIILT